VLPVARIVPVLGDARARAAPGTAQYRETLVMVYEIHEFRESRFACGTIAAVLFQFRFRLEHRY
jgi:hypothetical protein